MRKKVIAGNWKMNKTASEAKVFVENLIPLINKDDREVILIPPFTSLMIVSEKIRGTNIKLGAQNMHWEKEGAFTGEISPLMLLDLGIQYVIIGHSERRQHFYESDEIVNKKVKSALSFGIKPIICVGEDLKIREEGRAEEFVEEQVKGALEGLTSENVREIIIAYEPIWAIGTGKNATGSDANRIIVKIREVVTRLYGKEISETVRILYGGSVNSKNIKEFMSFEDIDGALVGGASLKADEFSKIVNYEV